jgi:hypothetical protein
MICVMPGGTIVRLAEVVTGWGDSIPIRNWPPSVIEVGADRLVIFEFIDQCVHRHVLTRSTGDGAEMMQGQSETTTWAFAGPVTAVAVDEGMHTMVVKVMGSKASSVHPRNPDILTHVQVYRIRKSCCRPALGAHSTSRSWSIPTASAFPATGLLKWPMPWGGFRASGETFMPGRTVSTQR